MDRKSKNVRTKYPEELYKKIEISNLIVFGIYSVLMNKEICTFERLVAECFQMFPKVFGFKRYPQWPDSLKFDRALRTLRANGLIIGSIRGHFELTDFGMYTAKKTKNILESKSVKGRFARGSKGRSLDDKLINYIIGSEIYDKFLKNPEGFSITESDFRSFLRCTLETPERVLKQNFVYYKNVAEEYGEENILKLLLACENKFFKKGGKNGKADSNG